MRFFLNNQIIVSRLKVVTGNKRSMQSTATAEASVQTYSDPRSELGAGGVFGKRYRIWCPLDTTIEEGDRVTDENGVKYDVRDVKIMSFGASDFLVADVEKTEGPND